MDEQATSGYRILVGSAAFVILVLGLRVAQSLVTPFLTAAFLAVICGPPLHWLQQRGLPTVLSLLVVIAGASLVVLVIFTVAGDSIQDFASKTPFYRANLLMQRERVVAWLADHGIQVPETARARSLNPGLMMDFMSGLLANLGSAFSNVVLVVLTLVFILLEASGLPDKITAMSGGKTTLLDRTHEILEAVRHYVSIKTWLSLLTGFLVGIWLLILGVDYPVLWGLLAFFFNFVPNIGSIIAAVPPVMLALLQLGMRESVLVAIGYLVVNMVVGNVMEPRVMGKGLGLSTLVVFVSLVFWGWVLGPIGMLFSVPLTMIAKIVLEGSDETRWIAILLGDDSESALNSNAATNDAAKGDAAATS